MKPPEAALRQLVRQWLDKATADFEAAEQLSTQGGRFLEIVAFHCQQAVQRQVEFPKTHDIAKLLDRVATIDVATANSLRDADTLTPFGVEARYPSDAPEVLASGEVEAIGMARVVRTAVMILLQPYLDGRLVSLRDHRLLPVGPLEDSLVVFSEIAVSA